jgi:hypothetical protein
MKLYEVPRWSWVQDEEGNVFFFEKLDGMYSYCTDNDNNVFHVAAWTEVTILKESPP